MFKAGLVSVSFRGLSCEEIIKITKNADLQGIEWGSDVHVPPNDIAYVEKIGNLTRENGLTVTSYGSYYRLSDNNPTAFAQLLKAAVVLKAPVLRLWAGRKGSENITAEEWNAFISETKTLAAMAQKEGITLCFECHPDTLTDDYRAALHFLTEVNHPNVKMYWQPNQFKSYAYNQQALEALLPYITSIHTFHWTKDKKLPLADGKEEWRQFLNIAGKDRKDRWCLLEFMPDDEPTSLPREADTLFDLLEASM